MPWTENRLNDRTILLAVITFLLVTNVVVPAIVFHVLSASPLKISHIPVEKALYGQRVDLRASVTGGVGGIGRVTLLYKTVEQTNWQNATMRQTVAQGDVYAQTLNATDVVQAIDYQICVWDKQGTTDCTRAYTISVGDFRITAPDLAIVYANQTVDVLVILESIGWFSSPVKLSLTEIPSNAKALFDSLIVRPTPTFKATALLRLSIEPLTTPGPRILGFQGEAEGLARRFSLTVLVPGFEFDVTPFIQRVAPGEFSTFKITLTPTHAFQNAVSLKLDNAVVGIDYKFSSSYVILGGSATLTLSVVVSKTLATGLYTFLLTAWGGGQQRQIPINLAVG